MAEVYLLRREVTGLMAEVYALRTEVATLRNDIRRDNSTGMMSEDSRPNEDHSHHEQVRLESKVSPESRGSNSPASSFTLP